MKHQGITSGTLASEIEHGGPWEHFKSSHSDSGLNVNSVGPLHARTSGTGVKPIHSGGHSQELILGPWEIKSKHKAEDTHIPTAGDPYLHLHKIIAF